MNGVSSAVESTLTTSVQVSSISLIETTSSLGSTIESTQAVSSDVQSDSSQITVITLSTTTLIEGADNILCMSVCSRVCVCIRRCASVCAHVYMSVRV